MTLTSYYDTGIKRSEPTQKMGDILQEIEKTADLMEQLASSLENGVESIQIIDQNAVSVSDVVERNSSTAERTARISKEKSSQMRVV